MCWLRDSEKRMTRIESQSFFIAHVRSDKERQFLVAQRHAKSHAMMSKPAPCVAGFATCGEESTPSFSSMA
jgi:hypothetical protein